MKKLSKILLNAAFLFVSATVFGASPPKNIISMDHAKEIATKTVPGAIKSSELEFEKKQWVYSFDILGTDKKIHEVLVSAKSGKVVSQAIESAAREAAEEKQDRK